MSDTDVVMVPENVGADAEGAIVHPGPRATPVQVGALVGFAALIAVILALVLVASRR